MSYARLLNLARAKDMFVSVKTRTSADLKQMKVTVHARALSGAGARPAFAHVFPIETPLMAAIDVVAGWAVAHFEATGRATYDARVHVPGATEPSIPTSRG